MALIQTDRQTDRQTGKEADRQRNRQTDSLFVMCSEWTGKSKLERRNISGNKY